MMDGVSPTSAAWVTQLVNLSMANERKPLTRLENQRDQIEIQNAAYSDVKNKITELQSAITKLIGSDTDSSTSFDAKKVSVTNSDPNVKVANASLDGTSAVPGSYSLTVDHLGQAHQIGSVQQSQTDIDLGYSGTIVVGGASSRSVTQSLGSNNPITGFGTASIRSGENELGSQTYSVELRQSGSTWQFRLVDENGSAVSIDDASDGGTAMTNGWQNYDLVKNSTFDTGRGLTIDFSNSDPTETQLNGGGNTATADYTAQGASLIVSTGDSLEDIRDKINNATYAEGNGVQATIVDRRLVLSGTRTGDNATITLDDVSGSVLQNLSILSASGGGAGGTLAVGAELQGAQGVQFDLNGIADITRNTNSALTDVVDGLSFDMLATGSATVAVARDYDKIIADVKDVLTKANNLTKFLKDKTEVVLGKDDENGNPTYTPATLGRDSSIRSLRFNTISDLLDDYEAAASSDLDSLRDIGITLEDDGSFKVSDETALKTALENDRAGVQNLFNDILGELNDRLDGYVDGEDAVINSTKDGLDNQLKNVKSQINLYEERMQKREEALTNQYSAMQSQLIDMLYQSQSLRAFSSGGSFNQLF